MNFGLFLSKITKHFESYFHLFCFILRNLSKNLRPLLSPNKLAQLQQSSDEKFPFDEL